MKLGESLDIAKLGRTLERIAEKKNLSLYHFSC